MEPELILAPRSAVRVRFTPTRRELEVDRDGVRVKLHASAHSRAYPYSPPLTVQVGAATVTVSPHQTRTNSDTDFLVQRKDDIAQVLLKKGAELAVAAPQASGSWLLGRLWSKVLHLQPGEFAQVEPTAVDTRKLSAQEQDDRLAWTEGKLSFRGQTLVEAVKEVNRFSPVQLRVNDMIIEARPVTGVFPLEGRQSLAQRVVLGLEQAGIAHRTPDGSWSSTVGLAGFEADTVFFGSGEEMLTEDLCESFDWRDREHHPVDKTQPNPMVNIDLPACDISNSLAGFAHQSGVPFRMILGPAHPMLTRRIKGQSAVKEGLAALLKGTGCRASGDVATGLTVVCPES